MKLLNELLMLTEADKDSKNLTAVQTILKFDGDIPHSEDGTKAGKESGNICKELIKEGPDSLWYISIDPPAGDIEAYVISSDKNGKVSYVDFTNKAYVIDDKLAQYKIHGDDMKAIDQWSEDYNIDTKGKIKPGCINALKEMLKNFK